MALPAATISQVSFIIINDPLVIIITAKHLIYGRFPGLHLNLALPCHVAGT
jgi:hypothetical protein